MNIAFRLICGLLLLACPLPAHAADSLQLIRSLPVRARLMSVDELGNTYVVREDNTLIEYSSRGDSIGFYRSVLNGDIGSVDATNPLRVLLYYPAYSKAVLLDRMLSEKAEVDLRRQQILSAPAVATASDGRLWVYDPFNARLIKLDETGDIVRSSNDLRQQLSFVPAPSFLLERDRRVYVCDSLNGVLLFDQFANYISTLPLTGLSSLQAFGQQLVYLTGTVLHSYDLKLMTEQVLRLPGSGDDLIAARVSPSTLSVLYRERLVIYAWPPR